MSATAVAAATSAAELLLSQHVLPLVNGAAVYVDEGTAALLLALDGGLARLMACGADSVHELPPSPIVPLRTPARSAVALLSCAELVHRESLKEIAARHAELRAIISFAGPHLSSPLVPLLSDVLVVPARPPYSPVRANLNDCTALLSGLRAVIDHSAQLAYWALGETGTAMDCAKAFSKLPCAREPGLPLIGAGSSEVNIIFLDRNLDLDPLVSMASPLSLLERLISNSSSPATAPISSLFDNQSEFQGQVDSSTHVPYGLSSSVVLREWLELLVDYPDDGLSLLRKKILALGVKARILGKPSAAQFNHLASLLRAAPGLASSDILLFLGALADAIGDSPHTLWLQSVSTLEPYDVAGTIAAIENAPTRELALRVSVWALLHASVRGSREPELQNCVSMVLGIHDSAIDQFSNALSPEPMPNMMHVALLSLQHNPEMFTRVKCEDKSFKLSLGLERYLGVGSMSPTRSRAPGDCRDVIVCVTGPVSWKEIRTFRNIARTWAAAEPGRNMVLVANGLGGGISLY